MNEMIDSISTMVESVSVMVLPVLAIVAIRRRFSDRPQLKNVTLGLVFAFVGMVVMENAVEVVPGIRTDPRGAVIVLAAAFGGWVAALITGVALAILRFAQGGMGAQPGVIYILGLAVIATIVSHLLKQKNHNIMTRKDILIFASIAAFVPPLILVFVSEASWKTFLIVNALSVPTNFISFIILSSLLIFDDERTAAIVQKDEQKARIKSIAENAPVVLFNVGLTQANTPQMRYMSPACQSILGYPAKTLVGPEGQFFDHLAPQDQQRALELFSSDPKLVKSETLEVSFKRGTGEMIWLRIDAGSRIDAENRRVWDGTILDITQQRASEEMKDNFISVVSHELRTPLTSIRGALGLAIGTGQSELPPAVSKMLLIANRNAERLVHLVNNILDIQKIRSGHMDFKIDDYPVSDILEAALGSIENFAPEKSLKFVLENKAPNAIARIDAERTQQILQNLLSNAVKFAPAGTTVTLTSDIVNDAVRLSVNDTGEGIPDKFRDHIFERFQQAESTANRTIAGTGLGLNISREFVEEMKGRIWFDSVEGRGTTFFVELPLGVESRSVDITAAEDRLATNRVLVCGLSSSDAVQLGIDLDIHNIQLDDVQDAENLDTAISQKDYAVVAIECSQFRNHAAYDNIRQALQARDVPLIVISGSDPEPNLDLDVAAISSAELQGAIVDALASKKRLLPNLLYVEDDTSLQQILSHELQGKVAVTAATSFNCAKRALKELTFDLIVLDQNLPTGSLTDFLADVPDSLPIIVFSAFETPSELKKRATATIVKSQSRQGEIVEKTLEVLNLNQSPSFQPAA